jgi:hypothetical protein
MHTPAPRTPAVAAMVVVVKEPMLLLHHLPLTFFCNEAQSTALSSSHDFHLCKKQEHPIRVWQKLLRFRWWSAVAALVVVPFQGAHAAAAPHLTDLVLQ